MFSSDTGGKQEQLTTKIRRTRFREAKPDLAQVATLFGTLRSSSAWLVNLSESESPYVAD